MDECHRLCLIATTYAQGCMISVMIIITTYGDGSANSDAPNKYRQSTQINVEITEHVIDGRIFIAIVFNKILGR